MLQFQPLTLEEIDLVRPRFQQLCARTCDYTVGGMFMWRDFFRMEYALQDGVFYSRLHDENGAVFYNLPLADDIPAAIRTLIAQAEQPVCFCTIPEPYLDAFPHTEHTVRAAEQPEFFDYLYAAADLATLRGKRFNGQRNQISQFKRAVQTWEYAPITPENLDRVGAFFETYRANAGESDTEREENRMVLEVLDHMDDYRMSGGVLLADGRVVGFSLGETVGDTLFVHIEKADRACKGAYQMLVNQFALRYAGEGVAYINREEDMGDEGLRRAKQSYHPVALLKKYHVVCDGRG